MSNNDKTTMTKDGKLGLLDSSTILIGGMIGSAIFSLSGWTIANAGPAAILTWFIAAVILFIYGMQTAELATTFPRSGGVFTFPERTLGKNEKQGRLWGWVTAWAYLFGCIGGAVFSSTSVSLYLNAGFPSTAAMNSVVIAIITAIVCGGLNAVKFSVTGKANTILTIGMSAALVVFIAIAFTSGQWDGALLVPFFGQGIGGNLGWFDMIPTAMIAYGSIVAAAFMVGEIRNPNRTVPKAMAIAMAVVVSLYLLLILATLGLVTAGTLFENGFGAIYAPLSTAAALKLTTYPWLAQLISVAAVLALVTTILVVIALATRTIQATANAGILPKFLSKNNEKTGSPLNATLLVTVIVAIIIAFPSLTNWVVEFGALCNAVVIAMIFITAVVARKKFPGERKFSAPGGNALSLICFVAILATYVPNIFPTSPEGVTSFNWQLVLATAVYFAVGLIIFAISQSRRKA